MKKYMGLFISSILFLTSCTNNSTEAKTQITDTVTVTEFPTHTETTTSTPTETLTASTTTTKTATQTPTLTFTPTPTSTPFGGTGFSYVYQTWEGSLVLYDQGEIISKDKFEEMVGNTYDNIGFRPSTDMKTITIMATWQSASGFKYERYIASMDLEIIHKLNGSKPYASWSTACKKFFVKYYDPNSHSELGHIMNLDGTEKVNLPPMNARDGTPFWSSDCSFLYWTRNLVFRRIDPTNGKSILIDIEGKIESDYPLQIHGVAYSPSRDKLAFSRSEEIFIANPDFSKVEKYVVPDLEGNVNLLIWSPDEKKITFQFSEDDPGCRDNCYYPLRYLLLDLSSKKFVEINHNDFLDNNVEYYITSCGFTADGKNIVISTDGQLYFIDSTSYEVTMQTDIDGTCPLWLKPDSAIYEQILALVNP